MLTIGTQCSKCNIPHSGQQGLPPPSDGIITNMAAIIPEENQLEKRTCWIWSGALEVFSPWEVFPCFLLLGAHWLWHPSRHLPTQQEPKGERTRTTTVSSDPAPIPTDLTSSINTCKLVFMGQIYYPIIQCLRQDDLVFKISCAVEGTQGHSRQKNGVPEARNIAQW